MKICLIRHGETDWNVIGRLQGREDIPLNENGMAQAKNCGLALKGGAWTAVVTSTLSRAKHTAEIIADALNIEQFHEDVDLVEADYGKASGLLADERKVRWPDGKYEGYEGWEVVRDRVCGAITKWAKKFYPNNIIIVSHGAAINAVLAELSGHEIGSGKTKLKHAGISMLICDGERLSIEYYNKSHDEVGML